MSELSRFDAATRRRIVVVLGCMMAMSSAGVDMSLAAIPSMSAVLDSSLAEGLQIVGVFILGLGLGQIPAGLMSDRMGRLPVVHLGVGMFVAGGIATTVAPTIELMLAARLLQGFGASVGIVMGRAMIRDMATREEAARLLSIMTMIFAVAPIAAPVLGSILVVEFGWRAPFVGITAFGILVFALALTVLRETGRPNKQGHFARQFYDSTRRFLSYRQSLFGTALVVLTAMGFMTVIAGAPGLIMDIYGFSELQFGLVFATAGLSMLLGSLVSRQLLRRYSVMQMTGVGSALVGGSALQLLIMAWIGEAPFAWMWACACLYLTGYVFLFANATAIALEPVPGVSGVSASLMGSLQHSMAALSALAAASLYDGTLTNSVLLMGLFGCMAFAVFLGRQRILRIPGIAG